MGRGGRRSRGGKVVLHLHPGQRGSRLGGQSLPAPADCLLHLYAHRPPPVPLSAPPAADLHPSVPHPPRPPAYSPCSRPNGNPHPPWPRLYPLPPPPFPSSTPSSSP